MIFDIIAPFFVALTFNSSTPVSPDVIKPKEVNISTRVDSDIYSGSWRRVFENSETKQIIFSFVSTAYVSNYHFSYNVLANGSSVVYSGEWAGSNLAAGVILSDVIPIDDYYDNRNTTEYTIYFENTSSSDFSIWGLFSMRIEASGFPKGFYDFGFDFGYAAGVSESQHLGYSEGYDQGQLDGYNAGYAAGVSESEYSVSWVSSVFNSVNDFLNLEPLPGFKLWYIFGIPLVIALVLGVLKFLR